MLTAAQCRTVAYSTERGIVCPDCVKDTEDCSANELIEYSAEELAGDDGLFCDRCSNEIIAPTPRCEECEELQDDCTCNDEDEEEEDAEDDTDDEEDGPPAIAIPCPTCGGPGGLLGTLGNLRHYRCGNCGIDFSRPRESR